MNGQKRLPPIFALGLTAVLVFLVLPNPLRVPQNNPSAQADLAPVPGEQDESSNANFGETNNPVSEGIGSGGTGDTVGGVIEEPPPEILYNPRNKSCFGDPPRQTFDPLSPHCVPFFEGDNGGSNGQQGVTEDEVLIVFYNDLNLKGDMTQPWNQSDEAAGHETSPNSQQTYLVRTVKHMFVYFANAYQTYNRRVRLIAVPSQQGIQTGCAARRTEAVTVNRDWHPFAVVHFGDGGQCFLNEMGKLGIPGFGINADVPRANFQEGESEGYVWGFFPDQETMAGWSASFICRKLNFRGNVARFANENRLKTMPRKFGLIFPTDSQRGDESKQMATLLVEYLRQECGMIPKADGSTDLIVRTFKDDGAAEAGAIMQDFYVKNVTTMICYCVPVQNELTVQKMQNAASALNYYPEWYWDHVSRMFRAVWNERHSSPQHPSLGTTYHWRNPRFEEQDWYKAFKSIDPAGVPNSRFGFDIYHLFLNLFQGLQGAGKNLTAENVRRGMFTFTYAAPMQAKAADNFFKPYGGYGSAHHKAVSPYTFIDAGMAFWWDPQGTKPGENEPRGCLRAVREGRKYHAGTWPMGDDDLFLKDGNAVPRELRSPCYQDDVRIVDTSTFGF